MKLSNSDRAIIDIHKLSDYCLNPEHPDGQHKARVFKSALGMSANNAEELRLALLQAIQIHDAILDKRNQYGQKYIVDFTMIRVNQRAIIHNVWIIRYTEDFPRLVTCYIF